MVVYSSCWIFQLKIQEYLKWMLVVYLIIHTSDRSLAVNVSIISKNSNLCFGLIITRSFNVLIPVSARSCNQQKGPCTFFKKRWQQGTNNPIYIKWFIKFSVWEERKITLTGSEQYLRIICMALSVTTGACMIRRWNNLNREGSYKK